MGQDRDNSHLFTGSLAETKDYKLFVNSSVTVQEGLCIYVPCEVLFPTTSGSVFGYWFQEKDNNQDPPVATNNPKRPVRKETQGRFYLVGDPNTHNCSLEIRDAKRSDTLKYYFRVEDSGDVKYSFVKPESKLSVSVIGM